MSRIDIFLNHKEQPAEHLLVVGFHDLTGYMKWAEQRSALEVLSCLQSHIEQTAQLINDAGGLFIKAIGDAGLFVFPGDTSPEVDHAVSAMQNVQSQANEGLKLLAMDLRLIIQMNWGPVACGLIGATGDKRFDVYGDTVNTAALLPKKNFTISPELYQKCSDNIRSGLSENNAGSWSLYS